VNLPEFATRRRVTVGMLTVTLVLFGVIGLAGLKVNLLPDLSYPTLTVRTDYEGAAPLEIENLISQPIEEAVGVVKNVRKVHSVSRTGESDVVLEFAWGTDMDMASLEVRDKLDTVQLPLEAKKPLLLRFNPSTDPILRVGLSMQAGREAGDVQLKQLRRFADEDLKKHLDPVAGVAAVKVGGGLEDEIDVLIDQHKLARLGIDINDVNTRLKNENVNASGGRIDEGSQRFLVRTVNQFKTLDEMRDLIVKVDGTVPVRLKDIADVTQGHKEREGIAHRRSRGDRAGDLQGRRRQHGQRGQGRQGRTRTTQGLAADRREPDHDRRPIRLHRSRAARRGKGRADRRRARDPYHLPVPRRRLEHVHRLAVIAGVADRDVLLHGSAALVAQRDVARRPRAGHGHGR
jgi:multidrug efflux pump subunit AcrB